MKISIRVSVVLRHLLNGRLCRRVEVTGTTSGECLAYLEHQFPRMREIRARDGQVAAGYLIYVNGKAVWPAETTSVVRDGDEIRIGFIMHGG